jgi:hypothetical protein
VMSMHTKRTKHFNLKVIHLSGQKRQHVLRQNSHPNSVRKCKHFLNELKKIMILLAVLHFLAFYVGTRSCIFVCRAINHNETLPSKHTRVALKNQEASRKDSLSGSATKRVETKQLKICRADKQMTPNWRFWHASL